MTAEIARFALGTAWGSVLSYFDFKERRLPNWLTLGGATVALAWRWGYCGFGGFLDGLIAALLGGAFMLLPFLMRGAGGGDLKMLFAAGAIVGTRLVLALLWYSSLAGLVLGIGMLVCGRLDSSRMKHFFRCIVDWRYDRKTGAAALPLKESEAVRIPFSLAIAVGMLIALLAGWGR